MKKVQSPSRRQLMAAAGAGLVPNSLAIWLTSPKQVRAMNTKQGQEIETENNPSHATAGHVPSVAPPDGFARQARAQAQDKRPATGAGAPSM